MALNKQTGQMYPFVTHTWNPIRGCKHKCVYCYVKDLEKRYGYSREPKIVQRTLTDGLGSGKFIFVGSTTDMFGVWVPAEWIEKVLEKCRMYDNKYLFQSKNPKRFLGFLSSFPKKTVLGTTIETNRDYDVSKAPKVSERLSAMYEIPKRFVKMISIEPIMDFDMHQFVSWIESVKPAFVSIGADSKNHDLPEPSGDKVKQLIRELQRFTKVNIKKNLKRLTR